MKNSTTYNQFKIFGNGLLNSYSQIFFSNSKVLAGLLILISFFDIGAGLSGVISILICQITATLFNFNSAYIEDGSYTYNSLMVGIALGAMYELNVSSFILLSIISVLTLFLTIWFAVSFQKKGLPFLSIPFLVGVWIVLLGAPNFTAIDLNQKEGWSLVQLIPGLFSETTLLISELPAGDAILLYLRSLGAIFFQYNDLAGLLIAIGILFYSRIAFGLSVFGFLIGYSFYVFFEGDFSQLIYSYIGFNFILTSIALGGFFVVPSRKSYLLLLFTIPVIALLISALHTLFGYFQLPLYSLPFNIVTLLFLSTMATRGKTTGITMVTLQQFSPEKNHYKHMNAETRFEKDTLFHVGLPLIGEWRISQGHEGNITHKGDWKYALDFDVIDEHGKTYANLGNELKDYFCFDLPVIAPADGQVIQIQDGIDDNIIGDVDLKNNWGNTVIIKHGEHFYSKLSHIRKETFTVKEREYIKKGHIIGMCGSSGRSPEPHLHFQLQATPYIGSATLNYPIAYYLTKNEKVYDFHSFEVPKENETVCNVQTNKSLTEAFGLIPGKIMHFDYNGKTLKWEVFTDAFNRTYIYCKSTQSTAYFVNNGTVFYFTDFYGKKGSLLHHFYYGAQKVLLGYYEDIKLKDQLIIDGFFNKLVTSIHDFTAPFFHYCKVCYTFGFTGCDNEHKPNEINFESTLEGKIGNKSVRKINYTFIIKDGVITSFSFNNTTALCIEQ